MTGTAHSYTAANAAKHPRLAPTSASKPSVACISLMSTPALNPLPSARSTTTRTSLRRPRATIVSASSNQPATVSAFTGGLSITTSAMPRSSTMVLIGTDGNVSDGSSDQEDRHADDREQRRPPQERSQ